MAKEIRSVKVELTEEEQKQEDKIVAKGIRSVVCPHCGEIYPGKYLVGIVSCGKCLRLANERKRR